MHLITVRDTFSTGIELRPKSVWKLCVLLFIFCVQCSQMIPANWASGLQGTEDAPFSLLLFMLFMYRKFVCLFINMNNNAFHILTLSYLHNLDSLCCWMFWTDWTDWKMLLSKWKQTRLIQLNSALWQWHSQLIVPRHESSGNSMAWAVMSKPAVNDGFLPSLW